MPPQTRAARVNAPAGRVYESPRLPPTQVKFQPRRQKVYGRHSLGDAKRKKQETLTQIGFVNPLTDKEIDEEIEAYEREEKTRNKRRKTLTPSSKFYTQTLTQLDFDSTPKVECRDTEDEDEDEDEEELEQEQNREKEQEQQEADTETDERTEHVSESPVPRRRRPQRGGIITVRCIKVEPTTSPSPSPQKPTAIPPASSQNTTTKPSPSQEATTSMPPPKTPTRKRTLEVPSSLSPATPLSSQSISHGLRTRDERSPLKPRSGNLNRLTSPVLPSSQSKLSLPHQSQISTQAITQDSPLSRVPDSSPFRPRHVTQSTQSPTAQVLSEFTAASTPTPSPPRRVAKTEIADSDADSDADLDEEEEEDEEDDGLAPLPPRTQPQPPIQVPSSPDAPPRRRWAVTSSSPPPRPGLAVKETVLGEEGDELGSQWTRSQLLPGSLGMDSLLALPPGWGEEEGWE
ncbi:hypothetical protein VF21_04609 [Pseudogymnoascus sp. 05NY08]|nr:hypothetical protein VF21_04609 [Pseudogymnoascus sp. 05NY08]